MRNVFGIISRDCQIGQVGRTLYFTKLSPSFKKFIFKSNQFQTL